MKMKKLLSLVMSMMVILMMPSVVMASESETLELEEREYLIVNDTDIVYVGEDYENPITGEYIRWQNGRGLDKKFTFSVKYSVKSSKFVINGSSVDISTTAQIEDRNGNSASGYYGHLYMVSILNFLTCKDLQFSLGKVQSGTITGLKSGGSYYVQIVNNDYLPDNLYLVGEGTIVSK